MSASDELAGRLRERVTITRHGAARGDLGEALADWSIVAVRWAAVEPDGTGDAVVGEATEAAARYRVTLRAGTDVAAGDRIGWAGRRFAVRTIVTDPAAADRIAIRMEEIR